MLTWLYVPGDRPDRFPKAAASGADVVILDLEDAVAPERKGYAVAAVREYLSDVPTVRCEVRVNDIHDVPGVLGLPGLSGLRLPKISSAEEVTEYAAAAPGAELHLLIESALGVERAFGIASAHPAVASVTLGEADLASDLHLLAEEGFTYSRSRLVVSARAAGLPPPAMSVWAHVHDLDGLAASCALGRALGMFGRAAIHPRQIPVIVQAFLPSAEEVSRAHELVDALAASSERASGTAVLPDGRFADRAMVEAARTTIRIAESHGVAGDRLPSMAHERG